MKNTKTFFLVLLSLLFTGNLNAQSSKALMYMDKIGKELDAVTNDTWDYVSSIAHSKNGRKTETKRKELVRTTKLALTRVKAMPAFEGNTSYRDTVASFLNLNYIVLNEDYAKIVDMEEIAEQSYDAMEAYMTAQEKANERIEMAAEKLVAEQKKFASSNNITLTEDNSKTSKKLEGASKVMKHYKEVYLVFFKSFKEEAYLIDAMQRGDLNALEQHKNTLVKFATEGKEKLKTIESYKGNNSVKQACDDALDYYIKECNTKVQVFTEFTFKKEEYEKIKAAFDAKPQSSRTKEDVDAINKASKIYNEAVNKFNAANNDNNNQRAQVIERWNKAVHKFLDRNVAGK